MIYVIFGASGSGKTTLLNSVYSEYGEKAIHKKGTTRDKWSYDDIEIVSYPNGLPADKFGGDKGYIYSQYGYEYGIERSQLERAIAEHYPHFVICNDIETIKKLRSDYPHQICVVYLRFDAPEETILSIQKTRGITDDEINLRVSKIEYLNEQFIHNSSFFDQVVTNRYGDNPEIRLWAQMKTIMASFDDVRATPSKEIIFSTIDYLQKKIHEVEKNEVQNANVIDKGFIFIIMPMDKNKHDTEKSADIWHVYTTIKTAAQMSGFRAERVDYIRGAASIDNKIYEHIEKAEVIIADLSYERPNCYFELGYAKALGKDMIIIARQGTKIHFDVEHYDYIEFSSEEYLAQELSTQLLRLKNSIKWLP